MNLKSHVLLLALFALQASGQTINDFRTPGGGTYSVATNWSLNAIPASNNTARIGASGSPNVTLATGTFSAGTLWMVSTAANTSRLSVTGGQLSYSSALIGTNGSTAGIVNNGGTLIFSNTVTLASSTGSVTVGYLTNQSGSVRVDGTLQAGIHNGGGSGALAFLTVNGGTVTVTGLVNTANATANSFIQLNGGVLETAGFTNSGSANRRDLIFNGGTLRGLQTQTNFIPVTSFEAQFTNRVLNGGAVIDSQGHTLTTARPFIQDGGTSTGGLRKLGTGTLNLSGTQTYIGGTVVSQGTVRLLGTLANNPTNAVTIGSGATFALARVNAIAANHSTVCQVPFIVQGGTLRNEAVANRVQNITLNGGSMVAAGGGDATYGALYLAGTVTVGGTAPSIITNTAAANGFFPLIQGGQTPFVVADATGDSNADLLLYAPLANLVTGPAGGIRKSGAGTMWIQSINTYSGETTVAGGVLALAEGAAIDSSAGITLTNGAVLDVSARTNLTLPGSMVLRGSGTVTGQLVATAGSRIHPGSAGTPGTLTLAGSLTLDAAYEGQFDLTNNTAIGSQINDFIQLNGDLNAQGSTLRIRPLAPLDGSYTLINYAGTLVSGFSTNVLGDTTREVWTLDQATPGFISLQVTPGTPQDLLWAPVADGNWDAVTSNWVDWATGTVTDRFYDLDRVYFDERGAAFNTINLIGALQPGRVFVSGASNYTFTGSGRLTDGNYNTVSLMKDGAGTLALATTNTFTGGITLSNGVLDTALSASLGTGPIHLSGGRIRAGGGLAVTNLLVLNASTNTLETGAHTVTVVSTLSGAGLLRKAGAGLLALSVSNQHEGGLLVSAGSVRQAQSRGAGNGIITLGDGETGTNAVSWLFAGSMTPTNPIIVSADGSGPATLGTFSAGTFTGHGGPIQLNRPVVLTDATGDRTSFNGPIAGTPGRITIAGTRITFSNPSNTFTGTLVVPSGSIYQNDNASALPYTATVTNDGIFRINNGGVHNLSALSGTGQVLIIAGGASTLQVGTGDVSSAYAGTISNGASALSFNKIGNGIATLSGSLVYSGDTTVQGGTLRLATALTSSSVIVVQPAGVLDVTQQPAFAVRGGQTLRGGGAVTGSVIMRAASRLVPGSGGPGGSRETLTIRGDVGAHPDSTNFFNLVADPTVGGGSNDLLVIQGPLEPSNSVIRIDAEEVLSSTNYTLITYTGAKTTSFRPQPALFGVPLGRKVATIDESVPGEIRLMVTGAPTDLVWLPQIGSAWNTNNVNWSNTVAGLLDRYYDQDTVNFTDAGWMPRRSPSPGCSGPRRSPSTHRAITGSREQVASVDRDPCSRTEPEHLHSRRQMIFAGVCGSRADVSGWRPRGRWAPTS